jgi:hypothetical protein
MSDYKDLQHKAADLGIKAVGVSKEDLEKQVAEAEAKQGNDPDPKATKPTSPSSNFNAAIVLNKEKREVRRYTLIVHGKNFEELANEFAGARGYTVKLEALEKGVTCPSCGHVFNPKRS